jgi:hypothetical protein
MKPASLATSGDDYFDIGEDKTVALVWEDAIGSPRNNTILLCK